MTSTVERPAVEVERESRLAAYDHIRRLIAVYALPVPCTIQFSPGTDGPLGIFVDTDAERDAWRALDFSSIAGRPTAVMSTQAARERLASSACASCGGEMTHQTGCPSEPSRVDPEAAARIPVVVIDVPKPTVHLLHADWSRECGAEDEHGSISLTNVTCADCLASRAAAADLNLDEPIPYVPVPMPTGVQANAAECARLRGEGVHHVPEGVHPRGHVPVAPVQHDVPIVEVTAVVAGPLAERDDNAAMAHLLQPQTSFAEAAERLARRDAEVTEYAHAMLGEASE